MSDFLKIAELDEESVARVKALEDTLGTHIMAYERGLDIARLTAEQLQAINKVGQRITSILSVDELLAEIVYLVQQTLGYYLVGIGLIEEDEIVARDADGEGAGA